MLLLPLLLLAARAFVPFVMAERKLSSDSSSSTASLIASLVVGEYTGELEMVVWLPSPMLRRLALVSSCCNQKKHAERGHTTLRLYSRRALAAAQQQQGPYMF